MSSQACPFWMGYLLLCPFRRLGQNPDKILRPYVSNGMTVLEVGPGMGFFTLPMARMAGPSGKVVCVDTEPRMLEAVRRRAAKAKLTDSIDTRSCPVTTLDIDDLTGKVDFVLLFAVAHEVPDTDTLFGEIAQAMKPGARCLVSEPLFHVSARAFDQTLAAALQHGLQVDHRPKIRSSRTAVLKLEMKGLIQRTPREAQSIKVLDPAQQLPRLT
jgi:ubiquinone/menaquinone biosynthesis C-methylase UbiE